MKLKKIEQILKRNKTIILYHGPDDIQFLSDGAALCRDCRSMIAIKTTGVPPRSVNTLTENISNNSTAATSSRLYRT